MLLRNLGRTNCLTHIPEDIKLELKDGILTLKAGSKLYVPNGKTEQKYYKYDNSNNPINLADSDNTTLITDGKLVTGYRNDWSTTQTYNINTPLNSNKIYVNINATRCQSSARIITTVTAITNNGEIDIFTKTYDYGATPSETIECSLPNGTITKGFKIFAQIGRKDQIGINADFSVGVSSNKSYESTSSDYDYVVEAGQNVFDEVVIESDILRIISSSSEYSGMIFYNFTQNRLGYDAVSVCTSGTTAPTGSGFFYNTNDNTIKYYSSGTAGTDLCSLPIAIVSITKAGFTSIDQVFNGFGYIGSTVFALPGVKGLIPNEFNANRTYKNINANLTGVRITMITGTATRYLLLNEDGISVWSVNNVEYKQDENLLYIDGEVYNRAIVGKAVWENDRITSLTPNPVKTTYDYKPCMLTTKRRKYFKYGEKKLAYACYCMTVQSVKYYYYAKTPLGSDFMQYVNGDSEDYTDKATSVSQVKANSLGVKWTSISENTAVFYLMGDATLPRDTSGDLYVEEVVEGTPDDYDYYEDEAPKKYLFARNGKLY